MNLFKLYATVSLDTQDYQKAVKDATGQSGNLKSAFEKIAKESETTKNKIKLLAEQYSTTKTDVLKLKDAFNKVAKEEGVSSSKTKKLADELKNAEEKAEGFKAELDKLVESAKKGNSPLSILSDNIGNGLAKAGKTAAKGLAVVGAASTGVVGGLLSLESSTEEYRIAQGKLNTAFEAAGFSADTAQQAYKGFYGILGDTDTATEASQLLAKLAENEEDVSIWTDVAAGVYGTFGDSLPIEGLIESANETSKVGTVTGVLADALNWAGISEDDFNAKLAACTDESDRNQFIMDTLADTYDDASDAFYRNNDALVESRDNQSELDETLGKVGDAVADVRNRVLSKLLPALSELADSIDWDAVGTAIGDFITALIDNGPTIVTIVSGIASGFAAWKITTIVSNMITALQNLIPMIAGTAGAQEGLNIAMKSNPIGAIITAITVLVTMFMTLWTTNEDFRNAVKEIWNNIKDIFSSVWDAIKAVWDTVKPYFEAIWDGIKNAFSTVKEKLSGYFSSAWDAIKAVWDTVTGFFENIWKTIKGIFSVVKSVLSGNFKDAWKAIKDVFKGWKDFFSGLWDDITDIFDGVWDWFVNIGEKIIGGIKQGIKNTWDRLTGWFNDLWDGLFGKKEVKVNVNATTTSGTTIAGSLINGSHALGLSYVPFDGYIAQLHRGEMILTKKQADMFRNVDFGITKTNFASSGVGISSAGIINAVISAMGNMMQQGGEINLVLPDGTPVARYYLPYFINAAAANGTPILNPQMG